MPRCNNLKNGYLPERKGWALYRRESEQVLCCKEGWRMSSIHGSNELLLVPKRDDAVRNHEIYLKGIIS